MHLGIKNRKEPVLLGSSRIQSEASTLKDPKCRTMSDHPWLRKFWQLRRDFKLRSSTRTQKSVFSDSQTLIRAILNKHADKEVIGIVADIAHVSSMFDSINFVFTPRSKNSDAGCLVKGSLRVSSFSSVGPPVGQDLFLFKLMQWLNKKKNFNDSLP